MIRDCCRLAHHRLKSPPQKPVRKLKKTPVSIRELWNPDTCPANLLPWLAWSFSVDRWMISGRKRQNALLSAMRISFTAIRAL